MRTANQVKNDTHFECCLPAMSKRLPSKDGGAPGRYAVGNESVRCRKLETTTLHPIGIITVLDYQ